MIPYVSGTDKASIRRAGISAVAQVAPVVVQEAGACLRSRDARNVAVEMARVEIRRFEKGKRVALAQLGVQRALDERVPLDAVDEVWLELARMARGGGA